MSKIKLLIGASFLLLVSTQINAVPLSFAYEGVVNKTDGGSSFDSFLGANLRIDYVFETENNNDLNPLPDRGNYSLISLIFTLGSNSYYTNFSALTQIEVNIGSSVAKDIYDVETYSLIGDAVDGLPVVAGILRLRNDIGPNVFDSDDLPIIAPDPLSFISNNNRGLLQLEFSDGSRHGQIKVEGNSNIISLNDTGKIYPVPEPAPISLLGLGLLGLALHRKNAVGHFFI